MAVYGNLVLTQLGLALNAKAQTGTPINFTRMQIGSGQLSVGQDPSTLTALIAPFAYFAVNSITSNGNTAHIKGIYENSSLAASKYSCEIGVLADDPDVGEILYAYANAGAQGDTIPPISSGPLSKLYLFNVSIGNASSVTATIPSSVYIPVAERGVANGVATLGVTGQLEISQLPVASSSTIGGVKQGTNITIDPDGTINGAAPYTLPAAATNTRGGVKVAVSPASGDPVATTRAVSVSEMQITTTAATTVATFTPAAAGNFLVVASLRVITAATNATLTITWTDVTGAQTDTRINNLSLSVGTHDVPLKFINAIANQPIAVKITAGTANQIYASATILGV